MQEAETRIQAKRRGGQSGFRFEHRVQVAEHRVRRIGGEAGEPVNDDIRLPKVRQCFGTRGRSLYTGSDLRPAYAIRPGASGDITLAPGSTSNDFVVWSDPRLGAFHPSALVYGGCYYQLHDRGFLTCNDPETGAEIKGRQRVATDASGFTASPWAYNGKVFALSEDGDTYVIEAGPEFEALGKNSLGEMALATPAVADGSLIIRTATKLYRIGTGD